MDPLTTPMKIDPHKQQQRYEAWKQQTQHGIPGISPANSERIKRYLADMELGLNVAVSSRKGGRGAARLVTLKDHMIFFARQFEQRLGLQDLAQVTEHQLHEFFAAMRRGTLTKRDGQPYKSVAYYVKDFKSFWHWHVLVEKRQGRSVPDITVYLDTRATKPRWVYLSEQDVRRLCQHAKYEYRVLMMFMFDTGIRCPTELMNVRVMDLYDDHKQLHIREETSKTFGRKINLLLCPELLRQYIHDKQLGPQDHLFRLSPTVTNRYLKRLARRVLGAGVSLGGERYDRLTMYDFRHASACYWLPRYKSESALKYRFGWKKSEQIHYYTELLGMRDTISDEDLLDPSSKTQLERHLEQAERDKAVMQDQIVALQNQLAAIHDAVRGIVEQVRQAA